MALIEEIRGAARETLGDGATTFTVEQEGAKPFFLVEPNFTDSAPLAVVLRGKPLRFVVEADAPRGLLAEVTVPRRDSGDLDAQVLARAHSFDPERPLRRHRLVLDRWSDGSGSALAAGSGLEVSRDSGGTLATDRKAALLTVRPMITVESAGVIWTRHGPVFERQKYLRLLEAMSRLPGGQPYENLTTAELETILTEVEAMVEEDRRTQRIFDTRTFPGQAAARTAVGAASAAGGGAPGGQVVTIGGLVHGPQAPERPDDPAVKPLELGAASAFRFRLLVCEDQNQVERLRNVKPWSAS